MFRWTLRLAYLDRIFWEESTAFIKLACSIKSGAVVMILPVLPLQDELKSWSEDWSFKFVNIMFHFVSLGILFVVTTGYGQLCFSHQNISIEEVDHDVSVVAVQTIFDPDNLYFSTVDRQFSRFDLPKKIECLKGWFGMDLTTEQVINVKTKLFVSVASFEVELSWVYETDQQIDDLVGKAARTTKSKLVKNFIFLLHKAEKVNTAHHFWPYFEQIGCPFD